MSEQTRTDERGSTGQEEAAALWVESYQGEVLGEAYFARMAELATDPGQADKIDHLTRLERSTREMLVPAMRRHGLLTEPDRTTVEAMSKLTDFDWHTMLEGVRPVAASFLVKYRRLAELVDEEDRASTEALIAHELALDDFCRLELAGQSETSLDAILALPHFR